VVVVGIVLAAGGVASAADLPAKAPIYKAAPVTNWTGFYVGAHGGGDWFYKDWFAPTTALNGVQNRAVGSHTASNWLAGGQFGFNYQTGIWVWGIDAQISATRLEGSNENIVAPVVVNHSKTDALATVAARFGVAWDKTLFYAKGGGAWAHDTFWTALPSVGVPIGQSATVSRWGWMIGVGAEYAFAPNWSVFAEYDYLDFGRQRVTLAPVASPFGFEYDIKQTIQIVKVGLNYKFGGL